MLEFALLLVGGMSIKLTKYLIFKEILSTDALHNFWNSCGQVLNNYPRETEETRKSHSDAR